MSKIIRYTRFSRHSDLTKFYISLLANRKNKNILNTAANITNYDALKYFSNLYNFSIFFRYFAGYLYKSNKYVSFYNDMFIYRSYVYIRLKWLHRRKKRNRFFYKSARLRKRAKLFFRLKKSVFLFFDVQKIRKQFFHIKIRTVDTNLFLTLTNYKHEVIIYRSTGQVSENRKKKTKLSPFTISNMAHDVIRKIRDLKIQYLILNINTRMNRNIRSIFRAISAAVRVKVIQAHYSKPIPHHFGTRKPKPKRL